MKTISLTAIIFTLLFNLGKQDMETKFIVVRHAEKASGDPDCDLSIDGHARAEALKETLKSYDIAAVYATPYKRTKQTVKPSADVRGLEVFEYSTRMPYEDLVKSVLEKHRGKTVLIAGHSNTVPKILNALGVENAPEIAEHQFDNMFIVKYRGEAKAEFRQMKYGKLTQ